MLASNICRGKRGVNPRKSFRIVVLISFTTLIEIITKLLDYNGYLEIPSLL